MDTLDIICDYVPKRRGRKSKKQTEKELMSEYMAENNQQVSFGKQRKLYENMSYLSQNEKAFFESRFTKPKNKHQEEYSTH